MPPTDAEKSKAFEARATRHVRRIVLELRKLGQIARQKRSYAYTPKHVEFLAGVLSKEFQSAVETLKSAKPDEKASENLFDSMKKG